VRTTRRIGTVLLLVALLAMGLALPAYAGAEGTFVAKINASRAAAGLAPLQTHGDLIDDARSWSNHMMSSGNISHNPNLGSVTSGWIGLGENVGVGPNPDVLHQAFMESSGHRANILGDYTHVGVGVVVESETKMWVTVVFMKAPVTTTTTTTQPPPQTTTTTQPPAAAPAPPPAAPAPLPAAPAPQALPVRVGDFPETSEGTFGLVGGELVEVGADLEMLVLVTPTGQVAL